MAAVTLLVIGDTQLDGGGGTNTRATDNLNLVRATSHDYVIHTGDVTNAWTSAQITDADARFKVGTPPQPWTEMHAAMGNHEYDYLWTTGWDWEDTGNAGSSSSAPWHSYDTSNGWHIVICTSTDSGNGPSIASGSTQYNWITSDLQANADKPTILIVHWGRYSGCSAHGNNTGLSDLWAYCLANAPWVEFAVSGHQHMYECFSRMNNAGAVDSVNGIRQFTTAPTGQTGSYTNSSPTGLVYYANASYTGILRFTLDTDHYDWDVLVPNGYSAITDTGTQTTRYTSGQSFTETPTDNEGLTDSVTTAITHSATIADDPGITDAGYLHSMDLAGNDPFGLTDSVDTQLTAVGESYTETPTDDEALTDAVVKAVSYVRADDAGLTDARVIELIRSDDAGLTDATIRALTHPVTDDAGLADALTADKPQADSEGLVDALAFSWNRSVADDAGLVDACVHGDEDNDNVTLGDSVTLASVFNRTAADDPGLTDALVHESVRTDSAGLTDTVSIVCTYNRSISDDTGNTDARVHELPRACPMALGDSLAFTIDYGRTPADDAGLADAFTKGTIYPESAGLADSVSFTLASSIAEDTGLTDEPVITGTHYDSFNDDAGLSDSAEFMTTRMVKLLHVYVGCDPS